METGKELVCMRCGRVIPMTQVFCKECLADMEKHPVKPGTPVQLPTRVGPQPRRQQNYRKQPKPEEIIARQKKTIRRLRVALVTALVIFSLVLGALAFMLYKQGKVVIPGRNYSTASTTEST